MEHIDDIELIEYISDSLPEARAPQIRQHIAECPACEKRYQDTAGVWELLGQWHVDTSGHQIGDNIEALAAKTERSRSESRMKTIPLMRSFTAALRVAAAILISIVGGYLLGQYSVSNNSPGRPASENGPRYVAALGFEWSSELTWTLMEEDTAPGEVNQQ